MNKLTIMGFVLLLSINVFASESCPENYKKTLKKAERKAIFRGGVFTKWGRKACSELDSIIFPGEGEYGYEYIDVCSEEIDKAFEGTAYAGFCFQCEASDCDVDE